VIPEKYHKFEISILQSSSGLPNLDKGILGYDDGIVG
jgi:hypothetical protein